MSKVSMNVIGCFLKSAMVAIKRQNLVALLSCAMAIPFFGCVTTKIPIAAGQSYSEDLSQYRPKFNPPNIEVTEIANPNAAAGKQPQSNYTIKNNIDEALDAKMAQILEANKDITGFPGFTVLAYSGFGKTEAQDVKKAIEAAVEGQEVVLEYDQPNFKVKVGGFLSRAEAYSLLLQLIEEFPESIIIPNIIKRNEIKF